MLFGKGTWLRLLFRLGWMADDPDAGGGGGGGAGDLPHDDVVPRSVMREVVADRDRLKARAHELESQASKAAARLVELERKEAERAKAEADAAEQAKLRELEEKKQYDLATKQAIENHQREWQSRLDKVATVNTKLARTSARAELRVAIAKVPNVVPGAIDEIANLLMNQIGFNDESDAFVQDSNGKPRRDPSDPTRQMSMEALAAEYLKNRPFFLVTNAPPASGGGAGDRPDGQVFDINRAVVDVDYAQAWEKADPEGFIKAWDAEMVKRSAR